MTPLRCGQCGAEASDDDPFHVSISYVSSADGSAARLDQGDLVVDWAQAGGLDRLLSTYVTCPACGHSWRTRRRYITASRPP